MKEITQGISNFKKIIGEITLVDFFTFLKLDIN